jgi:hypothetical protein
MKEEIELLEIEELEERIAPSGVVAAGNSGSGSAGNHNGNAVSNGNSPQPVHS